LRTNTKIEVYKLFSISLTLSYSCLNFDIILYSINVHTQSLLNRKISPRRCGGMKEICIKQKYILPRDLKKIDELQENEFLGSNVCFYFPFFVLISRNSCVRDSAIVAIYAERRNAKCENDRKNIEHVTRLLTNRYDEKSCVGQLTRRRAISGSQRGIKGAWEL